MKIDIVKQVLVHFKALLCSLLNFLGWPRLLQLSGTSVLITNLHNLTLGRGVKQCNLQLIVLLDLKYNTVASRAKSWLKTKYDEGAIMMPLESNMLTVILNHQNETACRIHMTRVGIINGPIQSNFLPHYTHIIPEYLWNNKQLKESMLKLYPACRRIWVILCPQCIKSNGSTRMNPLMVSYIKLLLFLIWNLLSSFIRRLV